jgi:hypothetical protein
MNDDDFLVTIQLFVIDNNICKNLTNSTILVKVFGAERQMFY